MVVPGCPPEHADHANSGLRITSQITIVGIVLTFESPVAHADPVVAMTPPADTSLSFLCSALPRVRIGALTFDIEVGKRQHGQSTGGRQHIPGIAPA